MSLSLLRKLSLVCCFSGLLLSNGPVKAEPINYFLPDQQYDKAIPTPEEFLGYELGTWHVRHDQVLAYLKLLAEKSDRAKFEIYGKSWEGKQQALLIFSSRENQQQLPQIRLQRQNPQNVTSKSPLIAWLGYSIHGNEASGTNASLAVAYYLAASQDSEVQQLLEKSVILLDPSFNPDGYSRFSSWVNANKSLVVNGDPNDRELNEPWPGARTNHYWFDLNRDWLLAVNPESRYRLDVFHEWHPHIVTDHHEMGSNSSYFFQPGVYSRQNPLTPERNFTLTKQLAKFHAKALDDQGIRYFTEEYFDDFYIGKGSTYPDVNGSIGILFEQASVRGHFRMTENGPRTLSFAIRNHVTTSLSTLAGALALNKDLKNFQRGFFQKQLSSSKTTSYVFSDKENSSRAKQLVGFLQQHHIDVYRLAKPVKKDGVNIDSGFIVTTNQAHGKLLNGIFDIRTKFKDATFYDVSAWALHKAFDLPLIKSSLSGKYKGTIVSSLNSLSSKTSPINSDAIAFVAKWKNDNAPAFVSALLKAGVVVKVNSKPFSIKAPSIPDQHFASGNIVISIANQKHPAKQIHALLSKASKDYSIYLQPIFSGLTDSGIDLGSPNMKTLTQPKIALVTGDNIHPYQSGEVRYLVEQKMDLPITTISTSKLNSKQLASYSHLVMVSGKYDKISSFSTPELKQSILSWVKNGGTLIAFESAAQWASNLEDIPLVMQETTKDREPPARMDFSEKEDFKAVDIIGGAIFATDVDPSHPLAYGATDRNLPSFKTSRFIFTEVKNTFDIVARYTEEPLISGYSSSFNNDKIANTPMLVRHKVGEGQLVLFADNPNFRGYWLGTMRLFSNSLLFSHIH